MWERITSFNKANQLTYVLFCGIGSWLYLCYRLALPRPIPGIPHNKEAVKSVLGDIGPMIKHVGKTKELWGWVTLQNLKLKSPIIQLFTRPLAKPWVVITDFREAQDILLRRTKEFDRSDLVGDVFLGLMPEHHISMKTNDMFKRNRQWLKDLMTHDFLHQVAAPQIYTAFADLAHLWEEKSRLAKGHPFAASDDIYRATLDAVWATMFGADPLNSSIGAQLRLYSSINKLDIPKDENALVDFPDVPNPAAMQSIITLTDSLETSIKAPLPALAHWFLRQTSSMRKAYAIKEKLIREEIEKTLRRFVGKAGKDWDIRCAIDSILSRELLLSEKDGRTPMLQSRAMYDEIFGFIVGAHDTTSTAISWALKLLADNAHVQTKLRSEIRLVFVDAMAEKRIPTVQEITKGTIPYLDAVINEIIRHSLTQPGVARSTTVDVEVLGHQIPKGTNILLMSNGPSFLSPAFQIDDSLRSSSSRIATDRVGTWDPDDIAYFKPERWLVEEDGRQLFNAAAGPLLTFGLGPRGCFGRRMASLQIKLVLIQLIWNLELQKCPAELSGYSSIDKLTHVPQQCYVRLRQAL